MRLYRCTCKGDEATLAVKHDGASFDLGARDHKGNPKNCIEALAGDTVIYGIPRAYLVDIGLAHPGFTLRIAESLAGLVGEYQDIIADLMLHGVEIRVAHGLARLGGPRGAVELTRCQLATVFAASREEIGRALKKLRAAGLVAYEDNGRRFHLLDKTRLATLDEDADL